MEDCVYFSFYNKKNLDEYDCINYRIPSNVFYTILKENKKDYLKLFSSRPEQIKKYLDRIDGIKKENGDDLSKLICKVMNLDNLDNEEYFYVICIPFSIKKKYSNTNSDIILVITKDKNDKGNKLSYFNIQSLKSGFGLIKKIDPSVDTAFVNMLLCKFNLNKEMDEILEVKDGIIGPNDIYAINIPSEISYDCSSYKTKITIFDVLKRKSLINMIDYKDKGLVDFIKTIQRDCGEDDINLKFKINLDYYGINNTHVII
jgi:hypothetical protein